MRLYIIGNGFDLAHGLKTKYSDYKKFIKESHNKDWEIVLEYYPEDHPFWSDAETNICKIDPSRFIEMLRARKLFKDFNDLDDLLKAIHDSFESFIISVERDVYQKEAMFKLDKNNLFLTFNYTTTLETLYDAKHAIHLHNSAKEAVFKKFFGVAADDCVFGHSPIFSDFFFYADNRIIGDDKDYITFRKKTTKDCKAIWEKYDLFKFFLEHQNEIDEVVFYGFSFSKADKYYLQNIFITLPTNKTKYTIYYHLDDNENEEDKVWNLKMSIANAGGSFEDMRFVNSLGIIEI